MNKKNKFDKIKINKISLPRFSFLELSIRIVNAISILDIEATKDFYENLSEGFAELNVKKWIKYRVEC